MNFGFCLLLVVDDTVVARIGSKIHFHVFHCFIIRNYSFDLLLYNHNVSTAARAILASNTPIMIP